MDPVPILSNCLIRLEGYQVPWNHVGYMFIQHVSHVQAFFYKICPALPLKDITIYHLCKISKGGTRFLCQRLFLVHWSCCKSLSQFLSHNFCSITKSLKQTEFTSNDESWCPWTFKKCYIMPINYKTPLTIFNII